MPAASVVLGPTLYGEMSRIGGQHAVCLALLFLSNLPGTAVHSEKHGSGAKVRNLYVREHMEAIPKKKCRCL